MGAPALNARRFLVRLIFDPEHGGYSDPLSLVSKTEELLKRKRSDSGLNTAVGIRHADHVARSIHKKLSLTSPTSGGR
jgi:hypothetical protein